MMNVIDQADENNRAQRLEIVRLRQENNNLRLKLKQVSDMVHRASSSLYELEFGITDGIGDLHTGKEN